MWVARSRNQCQLMTAAARFSAISEQPVWLPRYVPELLSRAWSCMLILASHAFCGSCGPYCLTAALELTSEIHVERGLLNAKGSPMHGYCVVTGSRYCPIDRPFVMQMRNSLSGLCTTSGGALCDFSCPLRLYRPGERLTAI